MVARHRLICPTDRQTRRRSSATLDTVFGEMYQLHRNGRLPVESYKLQASDKTPLWTELDLFLIAVRSDPASWVNITQQAAGGLR